MKRCVFFAFLIVLHVITFAQCYEPNLQKADVALENGNYLEAYEYYSRATKCPDASRFHNGQKAKDGMKRCLPSLTIEGKSVLRIEVGSDAGERSFNVKFQRIRMWLIDGGHRRQGIRIDSRTLNQNSFRASWEANPENVSRELKIHLYGVDGVTDVDAYVIIRQAPGGLRVNGQTELTKYFDGNGECCCFEITGLANGEDYTVSGNENEPWCKIQRQTNRLFVLADRNLNTDHPRECTLVVSNSRNRVQIIIQQEKSKSRFYRVGTIPIGNIKTNPIGTIETNESSLLPIRVNGEQGYVNRNGEIVGMGNHNYSVASCELLDGDNMDWPIFVSCRWSGTFQINQNCCIEVIRDPVKKNKYKKVELVSNKGRLLKSYTDVLNSCEGVECLDFVVFADGRFVIISPVPNRRKDQYEFYNIDGTDGYYYINGEKYHTRLDEYARFFEKYIAFGDRWNWYIYQRFTKKYTSLPKDVGWVVDISDDVVFFRYKKEDEWDRDTYGYCGVDGQMLCKTKFIYATPFSEGYAFVAEPTSNKRRQGYYFIDKSGNECFNGKRAWGGCGFSEGLAAVWGRDYENKPTFIDKQGNIKMTFDSCEEFNSPVYKVPEGFLTFSCGVAIIPIKPTSNPPYYNHRCWLVNKKGDKIIDTLFEDATLMHHGLAGYKLGGRWGIIDNKGRIVVDHIQDNCDDKSYVGFNLDGTASLLSSSIAITVDSLGNKFNGDVSQYVKIDKSPDNKIHRFRVSGLYGFYDGVLGKIVCKPVYDDASMFSDGLAAVKTNSRWGFIDEKGVLVIPTVFEQAKSFSNGRAEVVIDGKTYYIDKKGTILEE